MSKQGVMERPNEISSAVLIEPESVEKLNDSVVAVELNGTAVISEPLNEIINDEPMTFQKLEEKATKAQEALEKEEKLRKELEALNSKLLAEKTALLDSLSGEKGALQDYQEKAAKLTAQKNDLDNQLRVSWHSFSFTPEIDIVDFFLQLKIYQPEQLHIKNRAIRED